MGVVEARVGDGIGVMVVVPTMAVTASWSSSS